MGKIKIIKGDITKLTKGYNLPSRFEIHTVGPVYFEHTPSETEDLLSFCYENSLNLAKEKGLKTIAFPLISASVYGYPQRDAISVAIETMNYIRMILMRLRWSCLMNRSLVLREKIIQIFFKNKKYTENTKCLMSKFHDFTKCWPFL